MGHMKNLDARMKEARSAAFKILMEVRYDIHKAYEVAWKRVRLGLLELDGHALCAVIEELHAEGEPLKGVTIVPAGDRSRDVA